MQANLVERVSCGSEPGQDQLVFTSSGTLGSISIVFKGTTGLDFNPAGTTPANACTVGTAYTVGQTCNVNYVFTPKRAGLRLGGITLFNNANPAQILASVYLSGIGQGPQVVVYPGNDITVATGEKQAEGLGLDGSGNVYIADTFNNRVLKATLSGGAYTQALLPFTGLNQNGSVLVDGNGNLFLTNNAGNGGAFSIAKETLVNGAMCRPFSTTATPPRASRWMQAGTCTPTTTSVGICTATRSRATPIRGARSPQA